MVVVWSVLILLIFILAASYVCYRLCFSVPKQTEADPNELSVFERSGLCSDVAESKGFEPLWRCRLTVFKTAPL